MNLSRMMRKCKDHCSAQKKRVESLYHVVSPGIRWLQTVLEHALRCFYGNSFTVCKLLKARAGRVASFVPAIFHDRD